MRNVTLSLLPAVLLGLSLNTAPAHAQLSRTYVSAANGNDANNCDRPTPCRTFQGAHNKTNSDGEITVLDPGGYGGLAITKSISIMNDGVGEASILVSGGATGITINAGAAGYVNLRGITIQGIGFGGGTGLRFNSGFALTITNCVIRNHTGNGILFAPNDGRAHLSVSNTLVADNGGSGIHIQPATAAGVDAALNRVEAYNNSLNGISIMLTMFAQSRIAATVVDSVAAGNGQYGFFVVNNSQLPYYTKLMLIRSAAVNNVAGIVTAGPGNALVRVGQSTITGNNAGWTGNVISYGDNNIDDNGDGSPAPPVIAKK